MRTLNRSLARGVVPLLARLPVTPNQVTLLGLAAGVAAAWHFAAGASGWLSGALWLQASFVLDNCDGDLARRQGRLSGFGSWLDTASDTIVNAALFYGMGAGLAHDLNRPLWKVLGLLTAVGVVFSYAASFAVQVHRRGPDAWRHPDPPAGDALESRWVIWRKRAREDFSWVVLAGALSGHIAWLLWCGLLSSFAIGATSLREIARRERLVTVTGVGRVLLARNGDGARVAHVRGLRERGGGAQGEQREVRAPATAPVIPTPDGV